MLTLVTGATGLVGNNVVRTLLDRGQAVRVLVRESSDPRPLEGLQAEVVCGDVRDVDSVRRACEGADVVIHAAGYVRIGWREPDLYRAINVDGTRHVAEAARVAGARMIHVSSVDTLGPGSPDVPASEESPPGKSVDCPYVVTKREAERVLFEQIEQGLDAVIVNPGSMLGPWDWKPSSGRVLLEVARGWARLAPIGGINYCDVRDVAETILSAVERGATGRRYILGGENLTYLELFRLLAEVSGVRAPWGRAGPIVRIVAGRIGDLVGYMTGNEPVVNSAATAMSCLPKYFTSARAQAELGYRPRPVRQAAEAAWKWFTNFGYT